MSTFLTEFLAALVRTGKWRTSGKFLGKCSTELRHGKKYIYNAQDPLLASVSRKSHISRYQILKLY